jgi:2-keto-4-pentenoate hydratase/2-oxohepta-3-ene-1,7-dioic acid hydratase in catechol pathway
MKIICIGRNYSEHAKEMNAQVPEAPVFFMKPDTALLKDNAPFYHPDFSSDIHHELELVVKISKAGKHIQAQFAHNYFNEISVGIDFTARDIQANCKAKGLPWEIAKAFDNSAPIGKFLPVSKFNGMNNLSFSLLKNGHQVQQGNSSDMLFNINQIIEYVSKFVTLKVGDLIYTGTPAGVSAVKIGDVLEASLEGETLLKFEIK